MYKVISAPDKLVDREDMLNTYYSQGYRLHTAVVENGVYVSFIFEKAVTNVVAISAQEVKAKNEHRITKAT